MHALTLPTNTKVVHCYSTCIGAFIREAILNQHLTAYMTNGIPVTATAAMIKKEVPGLSL